MRLWHKDLIPVLPRQQLLSQWRECCCIARNIAVNGTPNHLLVNKIMDYPIQHFHLYTCLVADEMEDRGYKCEFERFDKWLRIDATYPPIGEIFKDWHNERYLTQCFFNLQEKYDCGGIPEGEWIQIVNYLFEHIEKER